MLKWLPDYYRFLLTLFLLMALTGLLVWTTDVFGEGICLVFLGIASVVLWITSRLGRTNAVEESD